MQEPFAAKFMSRVFSLCGLCLIKRELFGDFLLSSTRMLTGWCSNNRLEQQHQLQEKKT